MENEKIINSLSKRGNGQIYLGVVGGVRTGKSTFIKKFIENLVVPSVEDSYEKQKCLDELPQSGQGKMVMTTEPKFVPSSGVTINVDQIKTDIKLVDCVGYAVEGADGFLDKDGKPRMVKSPWYDDYIPLTKAAEIGTQKVIKDHATIAIVVTTDGSITGIDRENYITSENRVISELKEIGKPFIVILNTLNPDGEKAKSLARKLNEEYLVPVIPASVENLRNDDLLSILRTALYEYPVIDVNINIPKWIDILPNDNEVKCHFFEKISEAMLNVSKVKDTESITSYFEDSKYINKAYLSNFDAGSGTVTLSLESSDEVYNNVLSLYKGDRELSKADILEMYVKNDNKDEIINKTIKMSKNAGYSILYPTLDDMHLETPEIIKQGSRYGVKLKAVASSIHMVKVDVESTFEPIIGSEAQSKELVDYLMKDYEKDKNSIWKSEIFGRSLETIVREGIEAKLNLMPDNTRAKLGSTMSKIVNKGSNNLIAIVI